MHGIEMNSSETMADEVQMPHDILSSLLKHNVRRILAECILTAIKASWKDWFMLVIVIELELVDTARVYDRRVMLLCC